MEMGQRTLRVELHRESSPRKVSIASRPEACYFDCSNAWLGCQTLVPDGDQPKTCLDDLEACMSRCKGGSDAAARDWIGEAP